jgi:hypothetical protein
MLTVPHDDQSEVSTNDPWLNFRPPPFSFEGCLPLDTEGVLKLWDFLPVKFKPFPFKDFACDYKMLLRFKDIEGELDYDKLHHAAHEISHLDDFTIFTLRAMQNRKPTKPLAMAPEDLMEIYAMMFLRLLVGMDPIDIGIFEKVKEEHPDLVHDDHAVPATMPTKEQAAFMSVQRAAEVAFEWLVEHQAIVPPVAMSLKAHPQLHGPIDVKLVLVGPAFAGKTQLLNRYVCGTFSDHRMCTAFAGERIVVREFGGVVFNITIFDTAGQELGQS